ncbi:MAG TPA: hypothetical protein VMT67_01895 [Terriglobales bacterium]|nr:hypothetical protein [Terriglobales bacterium]
MTKRFARLCVLFFFFIACFAGSFLNGPVVFAASKRTSAYDAVDEKDKERPELRGRWMMRGRTAARGQSPAALRLRALRQKQAMRETQANAALRRRNGISFSDAQSQAQSSTPWVPLGPAPLISDQNFYGAVSGRVTALAIDPTDTTGNTVYVAAASGGVWKSANAANPVAASVTWTALTDQQASLVNGAISVKPDGSVVLVGTGEPNNVIDSYYGVGILRSTNLGSTWTLISSADGGTNLFAGLGFSKFAWSTASASTVMAATGTTTQGFDDGDITDSTNRGLYLSTDSGQTWAFQVPQDAGVSISPSSVSASDVVYNAAAGKFFAAIRYHGVYSSANGQNWTRLSNQPNPTQLSTGNCPAQILNTYSTCPIYRGQFAVVPGRNEMYFWFVSIAGDGVTVMDQGIWRSTNGGGSWTQINENGIANCGDPGDIGCGVDQGYYNLELAAVPDGQATDIYAGAVNLYKCQISSGATTCNTLDPNFPNEWINLTHAYGCSSIASVHPDQHGVDFVVASGKAVMYFGNDGGVYRTLNGFADLDSGTCGQPNGFDNLNASSVAGGTIGSLTQFVSFSLHPTDQNTIVGGTEGNGSAATASATTSLQWTTVNGGDGGFSAISAWTPTEWYTANPYVNIYACPSGITCSTDEFSLTVGSEELGGDGSAFYAPFILDPQDQTAMLVGTCRVWRGTPTVPPSSFLALGPDFDTLGSNTCTGEEINLVSALAAGGPTAGYMSTAVYATTEGTGPNVTTPFGGEVWVTTNAGIVPMNNVTGAINPSNYTISSVALDTGDATGATGYAGIMGFNVSHVFKTANAGATWTDWSGSGATGLPDAPVNALLVDSSAHLVYAGTDVGVFVSSTTSPSWSEVGTQAQPGATGYLPNVPVTAVRMFGYGGTKKLRVSTYGRGIWEYTLATGPDFTNVISNSPQTIFPSQTATFNGTLTALSGYASKVNLSCSGGAPSTCTTNPTQETPTATYTLAAGGAVGDYTFNSHAVGTDPQTITHDAAVVLHVVDFNLSAPSPNALTVAQGGTSNASTFQVTASGSFSGTVTFSCPSGLPSGAACQFSPSSSVNPTAGNPVTVTLTVTAGSGTPGGGPTPVTLAASVAGAPAAKTQTFTLTVTGSGPDFSLVVNATPSSTVVGQNVSWSGTLTALRGYSSSVALSCTGAAPGTCTVSPSSLVPTGSGAAFTVTTGSASTGSFNFGVQGTDGTLTHSQAVALTVGTDVTWTDTGNNSVTVQAGQSAVYSFSAAPAGGSTFTGAVNFSCANLPALTGCSFSPTSIAAGAGTTAVTLTISTTGPNSGSSSSDRQRILRGGVGAGTSASSMNISWTWLLTIPLAGIFLAGAAREKESRRLNFVTFLLALSGLSLFAACGGIGGGGGGQQPPLVTVTVSPKVASVYASEPGNTWPASATQFQFTAVVNNGNSQTVTWAVTGGDGDGTIDGSGLYSAPAVAPNPASVTVTASSAEATSPGTATINIETATTIGSYTNVQISATAAGGGEHSSPVTLTVE